MTPPNFDRQRAERFAQLMDGRDPLPAPGGAPTDNEAALAAIGRRLSSMQMPGQVDPKFRAEFRAVLVATAERELAARAAANTSARPAPVTPAGRLSAGLAKARTLLGSSPQTRRARTRGAIIAGVAVGAIAVSGISSASEDSVPGDALYGMKRSTERAQLVLAGDDVSKGELLLGFARTRTGEAHAVRGDAAAFDRLLTETDSQTKAAVSLLTGAAAERKSEAPLDVVADFVTRQGQELTGLLAGADAAEATRAAASLELLDQVASRVDALRAALPCGSAGTGRTDGLGPIPTGCTSGTGHTGPPG
ncbi:MAG TPA: DUF5667 domain-containing protein [Micromonosporaceae bacterium]|nr:DUF5667 domain-containing protein [Micromonosporaceae bacterium]